MTLQLEFYKKCIHQYLLLLLQSQQHQQPLELYSNLIVKFVIDIRKIFFHQIDKALYEYLHQQLFFKDYQSNRNPTNILAKALLRQQLPIMNYAQILIRFILLGLGTKIISNKKKYQWKDGLKKLIFDSQTQFVFSCWKFNFSEFTIKHLILLGQQFPVLQFYQQLNRVFKSRKLTMLQKWSQQQIHKLRVKKQLKQNCPQKINTKSLYKKQIKNIELKSICKSIAIKTKRQKRKSFPRTIYQHRKHIFEKKQKDTPILLQFYQQSNQLTKTTYNQQFQYNTKSIQNFTRYK